MEELRSIVQTMHGWIARRWLINTLGRGGYLDSRIIERFTGLSNARI
jgi:hypothetical protein